MVGRPQADVVGVLTRAPSAGGKSRLFAGLGRAPDPDLLAALLLDTLDTIAVGGTSRVVVVEPAAACDEVRALVPPDVEVIAQRGDSLGERMRQAMVDLFARGAARVVLIGSDLPAIGPRPVREAVAVLTRDPAALVLGPATDGGYYLIAAARVPDVFDGIEWGGARVLAQTHAAAAAAQWPIALVESASDVDTVDDLRTLLARGGSSAARTMAWARQHGVTG